MTGYRPSDPLSLSIVALVLVATLLGGLAFDRLPQRRPARLLAWFLTIAATFGVERICRHEPAGIRMLAVIGTLLYGMKGVVTLEARAEGMPMLPAWKWLGFASAWPGMRPSIFANAGQARQSGAWSLIGMGCRLGGLGFAFAVFAWALWHWGRPALSDPLARVLATVPLLVGLSLMLHFGVFNILAGVWRMAGVDARPLFRNPLVSKSLNEFWSRRGTWHFQR